MLNKLELALGRWHRNVYKLVVLETHKSIRGKVII